MNAPPPLYACQLAHNGYVIVDVRGALPVVLAALSVGLTAIDRAGVHPHDRVEIRLTVSG